MVWPFRRTTRFQSKSRPSPVVAFRQDAFTMRDALEGIFVLGATGSGKSTGSGKALALAYLTQALAGWSSPPNPTNATFGRGTAEKQAAAETFTSSHRPIRSRSISSTTSLSPPGEGGGLTDNIVHLCARCCRSQNGNPGKAAAKTKVIGDGPRAS